jgi:hypothetical protein
VKRLTTPASLLLIAACALISGCTWFWPIEHVETYPDLPEAQVERLRLFRDVATIAIAPVMDDTAGRNMMDEEKFETAVHNEIVKLKRFREVKSPREMRAVLARRKIDISNKNEVNIANALSASGADAILIIHVTDYTPYPPPRLTVRMRLYASGQPEAKGFDPITMSQAGLPSDVPAALRNRFIWALDRVFDTSQLPVKAEVINYARQHDPDSGAADPDTFVRVMERFFRFACWTASERLLADANRFYALDETPQTAAATGPELPATGPEVYVPVAP